MSTAANSGTRLPAVSVVIAAFADERWNQLCDAIESVRSQTAPVLETVVVVDHNPALLARARHEFADCTVMANTGSRGASGARNTGAASCHGEIVAFLDDDARSSASLAGGAAPPLHQGRHRRRGRANRSAVDRFPAALVPGRVRLGRRLFLPGNAGARRSRSAMYGPATWPSAIPCLSPSAASVRISARSATSARPEDTDLCLRAAGGQRDLVLRADRECGALDTQAAGDLALLRPPLLPRGAGQGSARGTGRNAEEHRNRAELYVPDSSPRESCSACGTRPGETRGARRVPGLSLSASPPPRPASRPAG